MSLARFLYRLQSLLIFVVLILSTLPTGAFGQPNAFSKVGRGDLEARISRDGSLRVIVGVAMPSLPEDLSPPVAKQARRTALNESQKGLLNRIAGPGVKEVHRFRELPFVVIEVNAQGLARLLADSGVISLEEDRRLEAHLTETPVIVRADLAWAAGYKGEGQTIAILDTGVDTTHPFFTGKVADEACFSTPGGGYVSLCPNGQSQQFGTGAGTFCPDLDLGCYHGTHVAGIALGREGELPVGAGMAPAARLIPVQVFAKACSFSGCSIGASTSDLISAMEWVFSKRYEFNIAAGNMSLGSGGYTAPCDSASPAVKSAIDLLRSVEIVTTVSTGNDGFYNSVSFPACISTAVSVGATTKQNEVATFSNAAAFMSLLAPGQSIYSAQPGGGYVYRSGTSMAAPHVAGAWGVLMSARPTSTVPETLSALQSTGLPITDFRQGLVKPLIQIGDTPTVQGALGALLSLPQPSIRLELIVSGLDDPIYVTHSNDGSGRLFIVEQPGRIKVLQPGSKTPTVFLDISANVKFGGEQGLLGLAFHPQYQTNRSFFVHYTRNPDGASVVAEYQASEGDPNVAEPIGSVVLLVPQPYANNNGGMIGFGPDGMLYIGLGDGGSTNDPDDRAQDSFDLLGKILRVDIDQPGVPYGIPPDNPFASGANGLPEVWALGFRNPWRFSFDRLGGQLYAGDVGQNTWEEIDLVSKGGNYGWRVYEGTACTNLDPELCGKAGFVAPLVIYGHTGGRCSVTGGYVYRGARGVLPAGRYVFGDYCSGEIFSLAGGQTALLLGTTLKISSFGETESGELLVVGLDGTIHRITGPSAAPSYEGVFESANCDTLKGWAWNADQPTATISVEILANDVPLTTAVANLFRQDLFDAGKGNGYHGFSISTPTSIKDGQPRSIAIRFPDSTALAGSPKSLVCGSVAGVNHALAANGGVASASSVHSAGYPVAAVNNGNRTGANWGSGGGWNDATRNAYPDWVQIVFNGPKAISEIGVFTLQDNYASPVVPTETMTFSLYGITSFEVKYWSGTAWVTVPGGSITGNNKVWRRIQFTPVTTQKIRVLVNGSLGGYSRIVEIEAWGVAAPSNQPPTVSLTAPAEGATFTAPADITVSASASDPDGTVAKVEFFQGALKLGEVLAPPYTLQWSNVPAGSYTLTAVATDNLGLAATSTPVSITVTASASINHALAANGGVASASSVRSAGYPVAAVNNGDRTGANWGSGGGWNDATRNVYPDWVQIDFNGPKAISEIGVFTLQDNYASPVQPTEAMTFSLYGITSFEVQYWSGAAWVTVPGGSITGNNKVWRRIQFTPVTTQKVRVLVSASLGGYSRIVEIEAWGQAAPSQVNHALAANGGVASASSVYSAGYPVAAVNNGDRTGANWGSGGGWNDATRNVYPDWVQIDFNGPKTISEIGVFTLQDNYASPVEPSEAMTFSLYGIASFEVQYWSGAAWVTVPGGSITSNNKVWRRIQFTPVTTQKVRVLVNASLAGYSRIVEIEAWGSP